VFDGKIRTLYGYIEMKYKKASVTHVVKLLKNNIFHLLYRLLTRLVYRISPVYVITDALPT